MKGGREGGRGRIKRKKRGTEVEEKNDQERK